MPLPPTDILLLDGDSSFAHAVATCLAEHPGLRLHVLSGTRRTPLRFSRHRASYQVYAPRDDAQRLGAIWDAIQRTGAQVLLPVGQNAIRWVTKHRADFTDIVSLPPTPDLTTFDTVADKWRLACFLERNGLPHPPSRLAAGADGAPAGLDRLRFPILLKPRDGVNGNGIQRFDTADALAEHLGELGWETSRYLIQHLIPGEDMDCSVLCKRGQILALTVQRRVLPAAHPFGPSVGVRFLEHPQVVDVVTRLMAALGWSGVANMDLRVAPDGVVSIIEINPRYWGSVLASLAAGVNFPLLSCLTALDISFPMPTCASTRFVIKHRHWSPFPILRGRRSPHPALTDLTLQESIWRHTLSDPLPNIYHLLHRNGAF